MSAPVRDWNADAYHRVSAPQQAMAQEVLDRLELRGDETVLDAGLRIREGSNRSPPRCARADASARSAAGPGTPA